MRDDLNSRYSRRMTIVLMLGLLSLVSVGFWLAGAVVNKSFDYWYLIWNLFLAWVPLGLVSWLMIVLRRYPWLNWRPMLLTTLWLLFLPNSFYLVTDFIHLQTSSRVDILYDSVMFESFVVTGLMLGCLSLYLVHAQLLRRVSVRASTWLIAIALLMCSFAIYLGRDLRLNSWDLLVNPAGILFSVSDPFFNPGTHSQAFTTTLTFFVFLGALYFVVWKLLRVLSNKFRPS